MRNMIRSGKLTDLKTSDIRDFIGTNPEFFEVYSLSGDYFYFKNKPDSAAKYYRMALGKIIPRQNEKQQIINRLADCIIEMKKEKL
jgi:hypothetical protein